MTRKENANARLRQTASASRARGANKERRGENDGEKCESGSEDSDGRNGQMRTEEQPEIVEEGLKGGGGGEREIAPLNPANIATDRRKKETRWNSVQVYEKWRNKNENSEYVNIEYVLRRSRQIYQVLKSNRSYL